MTPISAPPLPPCLQDMRRILPLFPLIDLGIRAAKHFDATPEAFPLYWASKAAALQARRDRSSITGWTPWNPSAGREPPATDC